MGKTFENLQTEHIEFLGEQKMFFVASAPLAADGHVNVSPKGLDSLRVISDTRIAYLDLAGSGIETVAHLRENQRIVVMVCAFVGPPNILRVYGRGKVTLPSDPKWAEAAARFPHYPSARSIVTIDVHRVVTSCGYGVPFYEFTGERSQLTAWGERKTPEQMREYQSEKNRTSMDGLPGITPP